MKTKEALFHKWNGLAHQLSAFTRIDPLHPLELFIGHDELGRKTLLLVSDTEVPPLPSSRSIQVSIRQRHDSRWAVSFTLVTVEQEDVFVHLCFDLIKSSRACAHGWTGTEYVISRYLKWLKLMQHQSSGLMGEEAQKGLIGELQFVLGSISEGVPAGEIISAWLGPDGGDRDFVLPSGWFEIKTVGVASATITISSLDQLDAPPPGQLVVYRVDRTAPGDRGSFSLNEKVAEVAVALGGDASAVEQFESKLKFGMGYLERKEYDIQHYRLSAHQRYAVDASFPKLTRSQVVAQIVASRYDLSLAALEEWLIP